MQDCTRPLVSGALVGVTISGFVNDLWFIKLFMFWTMIIYSLVRFLTNWLNTAVGYILGTFACNFSIWYLN